MTCKQLRPFIVDVACGAIDAAAVEAQIARHVRGCQACRTFLERERIMSAALRRLSRAVEVPPVDPEREQRLLAAFADFVAAPRAVRRWPRQWIPVAAAALLIAAIAIGWRLPARPAMKHSTTNEPAAADLARTLSGATPTAARSQPTDDGLSSLEPRRPPIGSTSVSRSTSHGSGRTMRSWRPPLAGPGSTSDLRDPTLETVSFVTWPGAAAGPPLESGALMRVDLPVSILPALGLWPPASPQTTVPVEILVGQDGFARAFRLVPE